MLALSLREVVPWCRTMAPQGTLNGFVINKKRVSASKDEASPAAKKKKVSQSLCIGTYS